MRGCAALLGLQHSANGNSDGFANVPQDGMSHPTAQPQLKGSLQSQRSNIVLLPLKRAGIPMNPLVPKPQIEDLRNLLTDLYELLEEYAPAWYSKELHDRLSAALKMLHRKGKQKESR